MSLKKYLDVCTSTMIIAQECAVECMENNMPKTAKLCLDTAEFCDITATFCARNSFLAEEVIDLCRQFCEACADECHKYAADNVYMRNCEAACRQCAEVCAEVELQENAA